MDAPVWGVTVVTKTRERLLGATLLAGFCTPSWLDPAVKQLLSTKHFSVNGTQNEA
ncbi:hypothetical protein SAMN02927895_05660 [Belnapia rosea]|nr:hypothetical protein SAMN02927895_05660 [Belnapia rosea]